MMYNKEVTRYLIRRTILFTFYNLLLILSMTYIAYLLAY